MLLLVADTSGKHGFVALARADDAAQPAQVSVIEEVPLVGGTFSAQLVPQISGLLQKHGCKKPDIGAFIVISGPGSFTGLRVGLAAIKALAEILRKPIVAVSLLEVVALANRADGEVLAMLDAGRGEIYAGQYNVRHGSARLIREELISREALAAKATNLVISTPDAGLAGAARVVGRAVRTFERVSPQMIAALGWQKLQAGDIVTPEQLEANYIRRSDAEILRSPLLSRE